MAAEIENILRSTNTAIQSFQEQMQKPSFNEHQLTDLQLKIESARDKLQKLMEKSPELESIHTQLKKQVVEGIDRINRERLASAAMGMQGQVNLFMGALRDFRKLLRRGERVERIGESEQQGH